MEETARPEERPAAASVPPAREHRLRRVLLVAGLAVSAATLPFFFWGICYWTATHNDSTYPESCNVYNTR